jgi:F-box and leucine-rich repeat protein 1 (S-phase kinase-associated protein 2)
MVAKYCHDLRALDLSNSTQLTTKCNRLRHLNLCGCCRATSDRALLALAQNCCDLQFLNFGLVTDVGVTGLAQGCPEMRAVNLCSCVLITDESVVALVENCPRLNLYYCQIRRVLPRRQFFQLC